MARRFAVQFYFAFVIICGVLVVHPSAQAPTHGSITGDILNGLSFADRAHISLNQLPDQNSVSFEVFAIAIIEAQERAIENLQEAATLTTSSVVGVSPQVADGADVAVIANDFGKTYLTLINALRNGQRLQRAYMDPRNLNADSILSLQAQADQFNEAMNSGWEMLPALTTKLGWALVVVPAEDDEEYTTLLISETEKASLMDLLETYNFGDDITVDPPGRSQAGASAKLLWSFLNMPWETTDSQ